MGYGKSDLEKTIGMFSLNNEKAEEEISEIRRYLNNTNNLDNYEKIMNQIEKLETAIALSPHIENKEEYQVQLTELSLITIKKISGKYSNEKGINILLGLERAIASRLNNIEDTSTLSRLAELYVSVINDATRLAKTYKGESYASSILKETSIIEELKLPKEEKNKLREEIQLITYDTVLNN